MHQSPESSGVLSLNASGSEGVRVRGRQNPKVPWTGQERDPGRRNQRRSLTNQCWLPVNG